MCEPRTVEINQFHVKDVAHLHSFLQKTDEFGQQGKHLCGINDVTHRTIWISAQNTLPRLMKFKT